MIHNNIRDCVCLVNKINFVFFSDSFNLDNSITTAKQLDQKRFGTRKNRIYLIECDFYLFICEYV